MNANESANEQKFERVWHGVHRSGPAIAWPTYLAEAFASLAIIIMIILEMAGKL